MNNGMVPIISYNYGAKKRERITSVLRYASIYAVLIMIIGFAIFQVFPNQIFRAFNPTDDMLEIGVLALRVISTHFIFAGVSIVLSSTFQAFGHAWKSMVISIARQLIVLIPVAKLLATSGNVNHVWWSFPIAEMVTLVICIIFYLHLYNKIIKHV
jgi:Na+-driven multidrug efflux pump